MLTNTVIKLLASESDISGSWYKIECSATSGTTPGGGGSGGGGPTPTPTRSTQPPGPGGTGLCSGLAPTDSCRNSRCAQYADAVNKYASGIATAAVLKAMMFNESTCNAQASSGVACGLMQFRPSTATIY